MEKYRETDDGAVGTISSRTVFFLRVFRKPRGAKLILEKRKRRYRHAGHVAIVYP